MIDILAAIDVEKTVIPVLIALISSGFIFGLVKVLPERQSILIQASENAVRVVNDAIATMQKELAEARSEIMKLEAELKAGKENRYLLEAQVDDLKFKVAKLEAEITIYSRLAGRPLEVHERATAEELAARRVEIAERATPEELAARRKKDDR
jgi:septal ring factor EnvC (AmiA/AmiB activator)